MPRSLEVPGHSLMDEAALDAFHFLAPGKPCTENFSFCRLRSQSCSPC